MSKTMFVHDRNNGGFWAYDVAVGIFLKYLIDVAESYAQREDAEWLRGCIHDWRVQAILLSNSGLHLDRNLPVDQLAVVLRLIEDACAALEKKDAIAADAMQSWDILDGKGVFARGHDPFPIAPVAELGHAIQALLLGTLPEAPERTWWFYGTPTGRSTINQHD